MLLGSSTQQGPRLPKTSQALAPQTRPASHSPWKAVTSGRGCAANTGPDRKGRSHQEQGNPFSGPAKPHRESLQSLPHCTTLPAKLLDFLL